MGHFWLHRWSWTCFALQSIYSWNCTSSLEINDNIINPGVVLPSPKPEHAQSKNKLGLVVGLVSGGCVLFFVCVLMLSAFWRKRKLREDEDNDIFDGSMTREFERSTGPKKFRYSELDRCTNNFAQEKKLGEGGFGGVFKGHLRELSSHIVVKRISRESKQGIKEYVSEVRIISRLRHRHQTTNLSIENILILNKYFKFFEGADIIYTKCPVYSFSDI
ncbi:l-type lectin-domain containing receptor kinase ix.2 [Nicotiana attenuata]|uniref:L-type lectin-domain containing receptor kinase ix.2 n=1 Tax=Nicotiana attenuata TaxID=49451 RepID=A0A1J6I5B2_NICAT|nr:l-type lectin-domain containing receptor kinase ix.2 [Nicotiana attenuata]